MWGFCYAKPKRAPLTGVRDAGAVWTWLGVDPDSKLTIAYHVGDRWHEDAKEFLYEVASRVTGRIQLSTDGHASYVDAVAEHFGQSIDYAMLVKQYGPRPWAPNQRRYIGTQKVATVGSPDLTTATTSHVERQNLTMRMGNRRLIRETSGFSKTRRNHELKVALDVWHLNFVRSHMSLESHGLERTPAMEAGLATEPWTFLWLLDCVDRHWKARAAKPGPKPLLSSPV